MPQTTIAQLLYLSAPPLNFARLVSEIDSVMNRFPHLARSLTWDCEDVAIFQAGPLRVLLAITDAPGTDYAACLTITAGPATAHAPQTALLRRADQLCRVIERHLATSTQSDATFWHRTSSVATADLVDAMVWSLADADLVAWAEPIDMTTVITFAPVLIPRFMADPVPHHNPMLGGADKPPVRTDNRLRLAARSVAVASAMLALGGTQWLALI
jgi:hypothetical protein